jgi:hypothetical protein
MHTEYAEAVDEYYAIEVAIKNGDLAYARELLRMSHQANPTAKSYYLSALVAHTLDQRIHLLQQALEINPDCAIAIQALEQAQQAVIVRDSAPIKPGFFLTRISQALFNRLS